MDVISSCLEIGSGKFRSMFVDVRGEEPNQKDLENFKTLIWELRNYLDVLHSSLDASRNSEDKKNADEIIDYVISNNSKRIFFGSFFIANREVSLKNVAEIEEFRKKYGFMFDGVFRAKSKNKELNPKVKSKNLRIKENKKEKKGTDINKRNEFMRSLKKGNFRDANSTQSQRLEF